MRRSLMIGLVTFLTQGDYLMRLDVGVIVWVAQVVAVHVVR